MTRIRNQQTRETKLHKRTGDDKYLGITKSKAKKSIFRKRKELEDFINYVQEEKDDSYQSYRESRILLVAVRKVREQISDHKIGCRGSSISLSYNDKFIL